MKKVMKAWVHSTHVCFEMPPDTAKHAPLKLTRVATGKVGTRKLKMFRIKLES